MRVAESAYLSVLPASPFVATRIKVPMPCADDPLISRSG